MTADEAAEWGQEISDPLYPTAHAEVSSAACEASAMANTVRHLQMACGGLLNFLYELRSQYDTSIFGPPTCCFGPPHAIKAEAHLVQMERRRGHITPTSMPWLAHL